MTDHGSGKTLKSHKYVDKRPDVVQCLIESPLPRTHAAMTFRSSNENNVIFDLTKIGKNGLNKFCVEDYSKHGFTKLVFVIEV